MLRKFYPNILFNHTPAEGGGGAAPAAEPVKPAEGNPPADAATAEGAELKNGDEPPREEGASAAEAPPAPVAGKDDPLLRAVLDHYREDEPEIKKVEDDPKPEDEATKSAGDKPPEQAAPESKKKPDPEVKPKKKATKKLHIPVEEPPTPPAPVREQRTEPAPQPEPPKPDAEAEYIKTLTPEQQEELAEAEVAERVIGDKHKGRKKQLIDWYKKLDETGAQRQAANPEFNPDEDEAFQKFLKTKPKMDASDFKKVQRAMGAEQAVNQVKSEYEPELAEIKRKQKEIELTPAVKKVVDDFVGQTLGLLDSGNETPTPLEESYRVYREKGPEEAAKQFPLESRIVKEEMTSASKWTEEYMMLAQRGRRYDKSNPLHAGIFDFLQKQERDFQRTGGKSLIDASGKQFLPRSEYITQLRADPANADKYWTFSHRDVLEMRAIQAKIDIERRVKEKEDEAREFGFERKPKTNSAPAQTQPKTEPGEIKPPRGAPKPAPGAAKPTSKPGSGQPAGEPLNPAKTLYA